MQARYVSKFKQQTNTPKQKPTKVLDQECSLRTCVLRLETTLGRSGFQDVRLRFKGWSVCPDLSKHATGTSYTHRTKGENGCWPELQMTGRGVPNQSRNAIFLWVSLFVLIPLVFTVYVSECPQIQKFRKSPKPNVLQRQLLLQAY